MSIADNHSGAFIGGAWINAEDLSGAYRGAAALVDKSSHPCFEMLGAPVPSGGPPIPAIGRLISRAELEAWAPQVSVFVDQDGTIQRREKVTKTQARRGHG